MALILLRSFICQSPANDRSPTRMLTPETINKLQVTFKIFKDINNNNFCMESNIHRGQQNNPKYVGYSENITQTATR